MLLNNKRIFKELPIAFGIIIYAFYINWLSGNIGIMPIDSFGFLDTGFSILKNKLPTQHFLLSTYNGQFREDVRQYNYKQPGTMLNYIFYNFYNTEESLANDLSGLPNQLKSMIHAVVGNAFDMSSQQPAVSPWNFAFDNVPKF